MVLARNWNGFNLFIDNVTLTVQEDFNLFIDNVTLTVQEDDDNKGVTDPCGNGIVNDGSFAKGSEAGWRKRGVGQIFVAYPGVGGVHDAALQLVNAQAETTLNSDCLVMGQRYAISAKYRDEHNPSASVRLYLNNGEDGNEVVAFDTLREYSGGWKQVYGHFIARPHHETENLILGINKSPIGDSTLIDDVDISPIPRDCNELIFNSDFELGPRPFWIGIGSSIQLAPNGIGHAALRSTERAGTVSGPKFIGKQYMDLSCLSSASKFRITAKVKLIRPGTPNDPVACDIDSKASETACPRLRIYEESNNGESSGVWTDRTYTRENWLANGFFNDFVYDFEPQLQDHRDFYLFWSDFVADADLIVDNFSMVPIESDTS